MVLDILLMVIIVGLVAFCTAQGLVRSATMLLGFYILCILVGMLVVVLNLAQLLGEVVISSLGDGPRTPVFYQGLIFVLILIPAWLIVVVLIRMSLEDVSIKILSWGDNVLGTLVGVVLALVVAAVICNSWGVFVAQRWQPDRVWLPLRVAFDSSALKPYMMNVLLAYRRALFPFSGPGYPVFFIPQG